MTKTAVADQPTQPPNYRFAPNALQNVGPGAFQSHYECRIAGLNLNDPQVLTTDLFLNCCDTLRAGDQVTICMFADQSWARLVQFVKVRIYSIVKHGPRRGVSFAPDGNIIEIPWGEDEERPDEMPQRAWVRHGYGSYGVSDEKGNVLDSFKTRAEAEEAAARINKGGAL